MAQQFSASSFVEDFSSLSQGSFRLPTHPRRPVSDDAIDISHLEVLVSNPQHYHCQPERSLGRIYDDHDYEVSSAVRRQFSDDFGTRDRVLSPQPLLMWNGAPLTTSNIGALGITLERPAKRPRSETTNNSKSSQTEQVNLEDAPRVLSVGSGSAASTSSELQDVVRNTKNKVNYSPLGRPGAKSKFRGVTVTKPGEVWQAQIRINGVLHALGRFDEEEAAARVYDEHALRLGRPINFPTVAGQAKALKPGSSKYRGVTLEKGSKGATGKWKARMGILGKIVPLGNFETEEEAARAYDERAVTLGRPTNFPQETATAT